MFKKGYLIFFVLFLLTSCNQINSSSDDEANSSENIEEKTVQKIKDSEKVEADPIELIKKCKFEESMVLLKGSKDEVSQNLYHFARARSLWDKSAAEGLEALYWVSPEYNGELSDIIKDFATGGNPGNCNRFSGPEVDISDWSKFHNHNVRYYTNSVKNPPQIGMTFEEVKESTWGEPIKINKTTYASGVKEQWVYEGNRYIYLEDGVVTAIQE